MELISQILNFINQGWVGSLIGIVGTFAGILGLFFFKAAKAKPCPAYQVDTLRLIERRHHALPDEVSITYQGSLVQRLTKTNLIFWNAGTDTLHWSDVVNSDPIRIVFDEEAEILRANIIKYTRNINACKLIIDQKDKNKLLLEFDFLDPCDGVSIEILHTSKEKSPNVCGSIRGIPKGILNWGRILTDQSYLLLNSRIFRSRKLIIIIFILLGVAMVLSALFPEFLISKLFMGCVQDGNNISSFSRYFFIFAGVFYIALPTSLLWFSRKRFPKTLDFDREKSEET